MIDSLVTLRHAEANFVLARHNINRADLDRAYDYSKWVINFSDAYLKSRHQIQDPVLLSDTLSEVMQFGMQIEDDDIALRAVTNALDIATSVSEEDAFANGWGFGFAGMTKAKITILSDIFSEESSDESYENYRFSTSTTRVNAKKDLIDEQNKHPTLLNDEQIKSLVGKKTEMTVLDAINNANRARRVKLFAVHTGLILDRCDIYVKKKQESLRISSDVELLSEDLTEYKKPQKFIQIKRSVATRLGVDNDYLEHIKVFCSDTVIGREELRELEYYGFANSPKPVRERVRTKVIDFLKNTEETCTDNRNCDGFRYAGVPLLR